MLTIELTEFSRNLEDLREFIQLVDSTLEIKSRDRVKENPDSFLPLVVALNEIGSKDFNIDSKFLEMANGLLEGKVELNTGCDDSGKASVNLTFKDDAFEAEYRRSITAVLKNFNSQQSLYQSALVSLISYVEWFLSKIIHKYYETNPTAIESKEKQLSLKELQNLGSIEDAVKYLIDSKVESVLRGSLQDWFDFLKNQLSLSMGYLQDIKHDLIEAHQRRNLFVHNGGIVNSIYLKNCTFADEKQPPIGKKINTKKEYIDTSISNFEKIFVLIASEYWKKHDPKSEKRGTLLLNLAFEHIKSGRFKIGESYSYFLINDNKQDEETRLKAQINYWQSLKWQGRYPEIEDEIKGSDFSAKNTIYLLAKHILTDEFNQAIPLIKSLQASGELTSEDLMSWPLFLEFRKTDEYKAVVSCE